jgi:hypothetical protein
MADRSFRVMAALEDILLRIERPEGVRRLGQALWMMVGRLVDPGALIWARGLLGAEGDKLLWRALVDHGAILESSAELRPCQLADFLCHLWTNDSGQRPNRSLVWTLPGQLSIEGLDQDSYVKAVIEIIFGAKSTLMLVSPYLDPPGMGLLSEALLAAVHRGVAVMLLTHEAEDLSSAASSAIESLRRECVGLTGAFTLYAASEFAQVLLHLKVVIADSARAIIGSANLTGKGLRSNLEVGAVLGCDEAVEITRLIREAVSSGLIRRITHHARESA